MSLWEKTQRDSAVGLGNWISPSFLLAGGNESPRIEMAKPFPNSTELTLQENFKKIVERQTLSQAKIKWEVGCVGEMGEALAVC